MPYFNDRPSSRISRRNPSKVTTTRSRSEILSQVRLERHERREEEQVQSSAIRIQTQWRRVVVQRRTLRMWKLDFDTKLRDLNTLLDMTEISSVPLLTVLPWLRYLSVFQSLETHGRPPIARILALTRVILKTFRTF